MPKKDPILLGLGECPEKWNDYLWGTYGLPQEPCTRKEVQQDCIRVIDSRSKRAKPISLDEAGESITQSTDPLTSLHLESGSNMSVVLSADWLRYLEFMDVIAEELSPEDNGLALKQLALADARSRYWEKPPDVLRPMNASLGIPAEFRQLWTFGQLEIRVCAQNRRQYFVEIWQLPPYEPEELDEAGEPLGHWEGLKFISDPPENADS